MPSGRSNNLCINNAFSYRGMRQEMMKGLHVLGLRTWTQELLGSSNWQT